MTEDPTKIAIQIDLITKHMVGVARYGNTPFDVPFISEIAPNLWQGGCEEGLILPEFIDHVISLYPWEKYTIAKNTRSWLEVFMYDSEDQAFNQVDAIAQWVNDCRKSGPTLVHCQAGLNRSSLIAARALILEGMNPTEAITLLREKRSPACLCNPSFEKWLLSNQTSHE